MHIAADVAKHDPSENFPVVSGTERRNLMTQLCFQHCLTAQGGLAAKEARKGQRRGKGHSKYTGVRTGQGLRMMMFMTILSRV